MAGYRAQRSVSKGASITLLASSGCYTAMFDCARKAAEVLGDRDMQELGDGIMESIPLLRIPLETAHDAILKLTAKFSVALVDVVCDDTSSRFVLVWKADQREAMPVKHVFAVMYAYDHEGETLEAVYATKELAESHPGSVAGARVIREIRVSDQAFRTPEENV